MSMAVHTKRKKDGGEVKMRCCFSSQCNAVERGLMIATPYDLQSQKLEEVGRWWWVDLEATGIGDKYKWLRLF